MNHPDKATPRLHQFEQDDIEHLRDHLGMPDMPYVDFAVRRENEKALQRWPLLAELASLSQGKGEAAG